MNNSILNQLHSADVIVVKKRKGLGRVLNHYIVNTGNNTFIGNLKNGVKVLSNTELTELMINYEPIRIKPFVGSNYQRNRAVNRAYSRIGQKYNLFNFNCEHFANWVQKERESSLQVTFTLLILVFGVTYKLIKVANKSRRQ